MLLLYFHEKLFSDKSNNDKMSLILNKKKVRIQARNKITKKETLYLNKSLEHKRKGGESYMCGNSKRVL